MQEVPEVTEPSTASILPSSTPGPLLCPGKGRRCTGTGASPVQREAATALEEIPPACVGKSIVAQTAPGFLFPLHVFSKVFICPLLTGKQVGKGHSLSHPASRCCSSRGFLTILVGSMVGVRVGSSLPWIIPASPQAEQEASHQGIAAYPIPQLPVSRATGQHYTLGASEPGPLLD